MAVTWRKLRTQLAKPRVWLLLFIVAWLTLVVVQISLGMGTAPER